MKANGRSSLTLRLQLETFRQKYPFAGAWIIANHFITTVPEIKHILQGELTMKKCSRRWAPHLPSRDQKAARVETSKGCCEFYKNPK
jgi:hypothetical protein